MRNKIHNEPNLSTMARMPDNFVDCVITSPPYYGLRDYGTDGEQWPEVEYQPMPGLPALTIPAMTAQLGLEPTPEAFVGHIVYIFRDVRRVLKEGGTCWVNFGDSYAGSTNAGGTNSIRGTNKRKGAMNDHDRKIPDSLKPKDIIGIPWRVAFALQADGWYLRSDIIWAKPNPMPESVTDRPTKAHEYLFLLSKSQRYYYDAEAVKDRSSENSGFAKQRAKGVNTWKYNNTSDRIAQTGQRVESSTFGETGSRNRRTVWTIATQPYSGAHFAVFPPALVKPCVLAGAPEKVCEACGKAWERVVEREPMQIRKSTRGADMGEYGRTASSGTMTAPAKSKTTGWAPTCACNAPTARGLVYDPFGGSGTTAEVAHQYGRDWIVSEINPEYVTGCTRPRLEKTKQKTLF